MQSIKVLAALALTFALSACGGGGSSGQIAVPTAAQAGGAVTTTGTVANDPANTAILELKTGKVTIRLRPDLAPKHVERFKMLVNEGFYNGLKWHRVIPGFMAQTGDPQGTGAGGSKYPDLPAEFSATAFERGTLGAARTNDPNTANSQFFITFTHAPHLNGTYTVFGQVVDGMQHVDQIAKGEPPPKPDVIVKAYMASAAP
ncbi:peptidylprolyl isomerase [Hyphomicrobium sp. CS1GBMeth3]|uniref:peptidylprolyl isomerase n=1 Tax=Hyphomicrobium sp. CS1GBMeth3 TaxID=1892845 RepID=UPI0009F9D6DD|nr:peptidylprolyl isomerase [Hyphomicrobium sp. CS1GBMeth3]